MATAGIMRGVMFLRHTKRKKDGKEHRYWSIVENRRVGGGRVVQRPLLYLGEINDLQELAWCKSIAVLEEGAAAARSLSLFPEDRCEGVLPDASIVRLKLNELRLRRPRQWGGCWLALNLWRLAYCLHVTLARRLHALAAGLTPRSVIEKFAAMQMIDLHVPTTDGRELLLTRYTEPEPELALLLDKLKFVLPAQPEPKISAAQIAPSSPA